MSLGTRAPGVGQVTGRVAAAEPGPFPPSPAASTLAADPVFQQLVRERSGFAWALSAVMLVVYLIFILLVAFAQGAMGATVGGSDLSVGILLGLFVIVFAFALTGVYVARANSRFDALTETLTRRGRR